jgi:DNA (cytosine-5)-methyltransferase 1
VISIDLFAGCGGLTLGLHAAGCKTALAVEIEPDFAATFGANFPDSRTITRDIAEIDFQDELRGLGLLGKIDLVAGGPPCQGFSTVGKKDRFDPRNSLFAEFLRCVDEAKPRWVLFENVSGFKRMYEGSIHETLLRELDRRGYRSWTKILDAVHFGLPQYRERTFVVATRTEAAFVWPEPTHGQEDSLYGNGSPLITLADALSDLPALGPGESDDRYAASPRTAYQRAMRGRLDRVTEHNCANYGTRMREVLAAVPPGGSVLDLPERLRPRGYFANTYARLWWDRPATTITRNFGTPSSSRCIHPLQNRALSTREGARLQGFPDDFAFVGPKTSKNLQIGNAVPPRLAEAVGRAILRADSAAAPAKRRGKSAAAAWA